MTAPQSGVLRQVYKFKCRREQIREGWLGCPAFISVMESADLRKLHHLSEFRRLYLPRDRSILVERQVSARPLVQADNQIPIVRSRERSVIRGIRGVGVRSGFTEKL